MGEIDVLKGKKEIEIALVGNPNSGKTCLFNDLTGARQHVGNWPGVTVEKKEGRFEKGDKSIKVIDLPGTYSLGAYSEDEVIARNYIINEKPDVVVNVVDSTNLERNLYLTIQLLEMNANIVLALNMIDEAKNKNINININALSDFLNIPVIPTIATRKEGLNELIDKILSISNIKPKDGFIIDYGKEIEEEIKKLTGIILNYPEISKRYPVRWTAIKLLEKDSYIFNEIKKTTNLETLSQVERSRRYLQEILGDDPEILIADMRYGYISGLIKESVRKLQTSEERYTISDKIDKFVTNRYLGIPIFLLIMYGLFQFTFKLGAPLTDLIQKFFDFTGSWLSNILTGIKTPEIIISFFKDGIIGGVGSVLVFIPPIFLMFFALSLLEDSGYMARIAYIMDRLMHSLGLHGKSFIPMLLGFGCNIPGIMATRTLENKNDRLITILINPFMSCTARLPVYVLFAGALFSKNQGLVIFSIYILGIVLAILTAKLLKKFLFRGKTSPFVMELPPYRIPTLKGVFIHMWEKGEAFVKKAGTIILGVVILIWVLSHLPFGVEYASQSSYIGKIGSFVSPVLKPAGFGTWQAAASLIFGVLAKEVVIGTFGVVYGVEETGLAKVIQQNFTPLSAYAFMVMTLIYIPCAAAIGAIKRETNSWGWTGFSVGYSLILGWIMAVLIYQGGRLLGIN
ncbi:ferrous iron transport protein B [Aceticella autotrophica]|uniref:Ferrous iron transport protein B n=1 Tax=Aceticella autotrophica TaxID=2755338 RepID=A0A975GAA3_9THEO|nr:ferrous iron transport protein B [Aceticella autotrophica]QSZ26981.1 ferrous iron transport protein B [Aceticella autotrophica]